MYLRMRCTAATAVVPLFVLAAPAAGLGFHPTVAAVSLLLGVRWLAIAVLLLYACFRPSLTKWIFVAMLLGAEIGHDFPAFAVSLRLLAQIFLRLIKVIIAPLIFATLVSGIAGHSDLKRVGRMGIKSLVYFEVVTTLALLIGLAAINLSKAGVGAQIPANPAEQVKVEKLTASETVLHAFPENIAKSVAENQVLQVVVFSILFGIALGMVKKEEKRRPMLGFVESLTEVMFKFTNVVMLFAPFGVLGAIAYTVGCAGRLPAAGAAAGGAPGQGAGPALHASGSGTGFDRLRYCQFGSGSPQGHGTHGGVRRTALGGRLRDADRLQL